MADLRAFLETVATSRPADLVEVEREVDPRHETAAIVTKLEEAGRSPILLFRNVKGTQIPVVTNVCGSLGRLALALGCPLKEVSRVYGERAVNPIAPVLVGASEAPCQEVVLRDEAIDLRRLPALVYHSDDAPEPYITAAIVVARDPQTHKTNLSYHRMMIAGPRHTGILMERGRHLHGIFEKYAALGQDMPIAVFIGVHPLVSIGALYAGKAEVEEYDVIGGLLQTPLPLVPCVTNPDLAVPAGAELVLEGVVKHAERIREGPFGEFTGYGTGVTETPPFVVSAMTHRRDMLFQDVVSGRMEHLVLSLPALEHRTFRDAKAVAPGVVRIALVAPLTAIVAVEKRDDDEPKRIIDALLEDIYAKQVIVVDADVDPGDVRQVLSAMALQTQPDRKMWVFTGKQGTPLDPSCPSEDGIGAKVGVDATRPLAGARTVTRNRLPAELLERIDIKEFTRRR